MQNGHKALDLTDLTELAHIKIGEIEFDIPLDISLRLQVKWRRIFQEMDRQADTLTEEQTAGYEDQLWELADQLLAGAIPPVERPAREFLNLAALLKLTAFLAQGYDSVQKSMNASPSPTPTAVLSP